MGFSIKNFKIKCSITSLFIWLTGFVTYPTQAQVTPLVLQQFLEKDSLQKVLPRFREVKEFYKACRYQTAWISNISHYLQLIKYLQQAPSLGLNLTDYRPELFQPVATLSTQSDSLLAELRCTDAAIHFFRDAVYGNALPGIRYNGLNYTPGCINIPHKLAEALLKNRFPYLLPELTRNNPVLTALQKKLVQFNTTINNTGFTEIPVSSGTLSWQNRPLVLRLFQLGILDSLKESGTEEELTEKIKASQRLFALEEDGIAGPKTRRALNKSIKQRIEELKTALNTFRWLHCALQKPKTIVVNIPSAGLRVYASGQTVLQSKVIVGKRSTPTPAAITSNITEVIAYPYWMVTKRIATREMLPLIKRDIAYLTENNLQVLNTEGKVVDPSKINWELLSTANFPYVLRQSTGCDNSLGLVKLNFYNPFTVYLHDTPLKELFNENRRYFSHGCIRVEKAMDLARFVLAENRIAVDTLSEKGCLRNQQPIPVPVVEKVPVFIMYSTAWPDSTGTIRFYEDIYRRLKS